MTGDEGKKWFHQLLWNIAVHLAAEELVLYEALDKIGAKALADKSRLEQHGIKVICREIDGQPLTPEVSATSRSWKAYKLEEFPWNDYKGVE